MRSRRGAGEEEVRRMWGGAEEEVRTGGGEEEVRRMWEGGEEELRRGRGGCEDDVRRK